MLELFGELDLGSVPALERELDALTAPGRTVVLDLRALAFMDSTGLRTILAADERLRGADARLVLVRGPKAVDRVFRITGTAERLEFVD